ncbi:His/Gly/Thr/Pro-type tRNA ligase C-terminal domain-containing protein [Bradyrhizobium elkanii]
MPGSEPLPMTAPALSRRVAVAREMAVPVMAIVGGCEMRDVRVSLRERDDLQADVPLAEAVSRLQARARPGTLAAEACDSRGFGGCCPSKRFEHLRDEHHVQPLMTQFPGFLPRAKSIASDGANDQFCAKCAICLEYCAI